MSCTNAEAIPRPALASHTGSDVFHHVATLIASSVGSSSSSGS